MLATICLSTALSLTASTLDSDDPHRVQWKGRPVDLSALGKSVSQDRIIALDRHLDRYAPWMDEHKYRAAVSADGRVLLIAESQPTLKDRMKLVEKALDAFDELLPELDRSESEETFLTVGLGDSDHIPDQHPIVLVEVDTPDAYAALLGEVGKIDASLEAWASAQARKPGFFEGRIGVAGWQRIPRDFDLGSVWRTKNELVNRLSRLALYRSYGPQPTWLSVGLAWRVEMEVMGTLYSFPYRTEFVGVVEHEGWKAELKSRFRKRKKSKSPLRADEFAAWRPNTWRVEEAANAWGVVEFLAKYEAEALPEIAEDFRVAYKAGFRTTAPDGTWTTDPSFMIPPDEQLAILESHTRPELLSALTSFFATWKKPR